MCCYILLVLRKPPPLIHITDQSEDHKQLDELGMTIQSGAVDKPCPCPRRFVWALPTSEFAVTSQSVPKDVDWHVSKTSTEEGESHLGFA